MSEEKKKEGMSVKEIEGYAKKYQFELFFCLLFILASLFSLIFWGPTLSILLAGIGGVIGTLLPNKAGNLFEKGCHGILKQSETTLIIIGILGLIIAIFLAPIIFLTVGLYAGKSLLLHTKEISSKQDGGDQGKETQNQ